MGHHGGVAREARDVVPVILRRRSRRQPLRRARALSRSRRRGAARTAPRGARTSSRDSFTPSAATASSRCCIFVAPTMGAVTPSFWSSHASAICACGSPRAFATRVERAEHARVGLLHRGVEPLAEADRSRSASSLAPRRAREAAARERAPRDHADALVAAERPSSRAPPRGRAGCSGSASRRSASSRGRLGDVLRLGELPRVHRRRAEVARLARASRRRAAPPSSPRSASRRPSGGSGRGRRSRCRGAAGSRRSRGRWPCATGPRPFGPGRIAP